jgi:DNA polymerase-4
VTLPDSTDDGKVLGDAALRLWDRNRPRKAVRLVGVAMAGIEDAATEQLGLFGAGARTRQAALNRALDRIVERFGRESIVRGGAREEKGLTTRLKRGE